MYTPACAYSESVTGTAIVPEQMPQTPSTNKLK